MVAILGTGTLTVGKATLTTTLLPAGTRSLKAIYSGDANYTLSTSSPVFQTVKTVPSTAFGYPVVTPAGIIPSVVGDFDGDGKNDLAGLTLGDSTALVGVGIQLGNGDGTFQPAINTFLSDTIT